MMAVCESRSCRKAECGAEFELRLDTFAEESAEACAVELAPDGVCCADHPPVDKAGWTLVVYDNGQWAMGSDGVLAQQVWQTGEIRQLWFRTDSQILGPNVPDQAIQQRTAYVGNDDLKAVVMSAKEAILSNAASAGWGYFVLAEAIRQLRAEGKLSAGDALCIVARVDKPKGWRYRPDPYFRAVAPLVKVALDNLDGFESPWKEEDLTMPEKVEILTRDLPSSFLDPLYERYPELVMQAIAKSRDKYDYDPEKPLGRAVVERLYGQAREGSPHALVHLEEMGVSLDAWLDQAFSEIMSPAATAGMWYLSGSRPWPSQVSGMGGLGNNPPAPEKYIRRLVEGLDGLDEEAMPGVREVAFLSAAVELMSKDLPYSFELAKSATRRVVRHVFILSIWGKADLPGLAEWIAEAADIRPIFREAALVRAGVVSAGDQLAARGFVLREDGRYAGWVTVKQLDGVRAGDVLRQSEVCPRLHRNMVEVFLSPQESGEWAEVVTSSGRGYMVAFETDDEGPLLLALEVVTTGRFCRDGEYGEVSTEGGGLDEA